MNLQNLILKKDKKYDLEERSLIFAQSVIDLVKKIPHDSVNKRLIGQVVASAGSIGANYCEANESESKKDFVHKITIAKKEIKETLHWIRLLATSNPEYKEKLRDLWSECHQLLLIFSKIISSSRSKKV